MKRVKRDTAKRSVVKTLVWELSGLLVLFFVSWFISGDVWFSTKASLVVYVIRVPLYFCHERFWENIQWGR